MTSKDRHRRPSLLFLEAINFELTYQCDMACSHCLQQGLRDTKSFNGWIFTDVVLRSIKEAYVSGLLKTGLNFSGGEIFTPDSNLPEILGAIRPLNLDVRVNTNGRWGNQRNIQIGNLVFNSPGQVVAWLRDMNVTVLALSFDRRFKEGSRWWTCLASVIRECENQGQLYQVVLTGVSTEMMMDGYDRLTKVIDTPLEHLLPVSMEMIDIGGAANQMDESLQFDSFVSLLNKLECGGKGFFRPIFLHIAPDGGVRSCLYSPGSGWLGNIYQDSLSQIAHYFEENIVVQAFSKEDGKNMCENLLKPFTGIYKSIKTPCAAAAIFSKVLESYNQFKKDYRREPAHEELFLINKRVAQDLNLKR